MSRPGTRPNLRPSALSRAAKPRHGRLEPILMFQIWKSKSKHVYLDNHALPTHRSTTTTILVLPPRATKAFQAFVALRSSSPLPMKPINSKSGHQHQISTTGDNDTLPTPHSIPSIISRLPLTATDTLKASIVVCSSSPLGTWSLTPGKYPVPSYLVPARLTSAQH